MAEAISQFLDMKRGENIVDMAHYVGSFEGEADGAVAYLQSKSWPGNVRELENMVYRLAIFARSGCIALADVEAEARRVVKNESTDGEAVEHPDRLLELERQHTVRILKVTRGNKSEAARRLGIERKTLYKKAVRLGIDLQAAEEL